MRSILQKVERNIQGIKGKVAVAVSGGMDSMCLLHVLLALGKDNFQVIVLNVEHGIRGESSKRDSEFVSLYCVLHDIECISVSVNAPQYASNHKVSIESAARILRYEFFQQVLDDNVADYVALAHHSDDLCETVMMRIFRGTGVSGLVGIQNRDRFIRPLLNISRNEIFDYVCENGIGFVMDETNNQSDYSRNFIRNEVFPLVESKWKDYRKSIIRLSEIAKEYQDYFDKISPKPVVELDNSISLNINVLKSCEQVICKHAIRRAVDLINNGVDFEERHLNSVIELLHKRNGASVDLGSNLKALKEYDKLVFAYCPPFEFLPQRFSVGEFEFGGKVWQIVPRTNEPIRFDLSKIPPEAVIRARTDGDIFTRFGNKTTSLGDFYTNKKIPLRKRDSYPVIAVDNKILVTPIEIADCVKSSGENEYTLKQKSN